MNDVIGKRSIFTPSFSSHAPSTIILAQQTMVLSQPDPFNRHYCLFHVAKFGAKT